MHMRKTTSRKAPTAKPRMPTEGGRLLEAFLERRKFSVQGFCRDHGLDRVQVLRVISGELGQRISVDFAASISDATKGVVPWRAFHSSTRRVVEAAATGTEG